MIKKTIVLALYIFVAFGTWASEKKVKEMQSLVLSSPKSAAPVIYVAGQDAELTRSFALWTSFFENRHFKVSTLTGDGAKVDLPSKVAVLAFETVASCPLAQKVGLDLSSLNNARDESYVLSVRMWNKRPLVLVVGKTPAGAEAGAWRLLSRVAYWDGVVSITPMEEVNRPFIKIREMHLCARPDYLNWDKARLATYPRYLKASGFNSVQIMECLSYWGYDGEEKWTREKVAPVVRTIAKSAHKEGMRVSQFVWGEELLADKTLIAVSAHTYADEVDHLITHWGDPGPGGYAVPQRTTVKLLEEYRKINPNCTASVSTWYNHGFWDEERAKKEGAKKMLDETFSPKEIGIALHRWWDDLGTAEGLNPKRAALILEAGRPLGIWGWYLSDYEMTPGEHLRTRVVDKYFSALPEEVSGKVDWISLEKIFHGRESRINQYVAGQKMWNPRKPLRDIMMDYCRAMYGPAYATVMCDAYECAEAIQTQYIRGNIPTYDLFPVVGGDPVFAQRLQKVLVDLKEVKLPADWQPNIPDVGSPTEDIKVLIHRLGQQDGGIKYEGSMAQP